MNENAMSHCPAFHKNYVDIFNTFISTKEITHRKCLADGSMHKIIIKRVHRTF